IVSGRFLPRLPACFCANRPNSTNLVLVGSRVRPNFPNRRRKASCTRMASERYWKQITKSSIEAPPVARWLTPNVGDLPPSLHGHYPASSRPRLSPPLPPASFLSSSLLHYLY